MRQQGHNRPKLILVLAPLAAGFVLVAGCSSSSGSSASGSAGAGSAASTATGSPVKVMVLGSIQSSQLAVPGIQYGAQAGADALNAAGGLNGHKIDLIACNDQAEENIAAACARQAVSDKVIAVVGTLTLYGPAVLPILAAAGIPDVAPYPITPIEATSPYSFPFEGGNTIEGRAVAQMIAMLKIKQVSQIVLNNAPSEEQASDIKTALGKRGISVSKVVSVSTTTTDMSPVVATATAGNVGAIAYSAEPNQIAPTITAARQQGTKAPLVFTASVLTPDVIQPLGSAADGTYACGSFPPLTATSVPGVSEFIADMSKYQPGKQLDDFGLNAWAGMQMLKLGLGNATTVDAASLFKGLNAVNGVPFLWIKNFSLQPNPDSSIARITNDEAFFAEVENGKLTLIGGPTPLPY
jgi:ABC-type branched-subunit amino acid transport system substrate-binding protein